jgi:hypothetical protein
MHSSKQGDYLFERKQEGDISTIPCVTNGLGRSEAIKTSNIGQAVA